MGTSLFNQLVPLAGGRYLHWGVVSISLTNALIIGLMVIVFLLALVLPFPGGHDRGGRS
jgi:hypothetical protein